MARPFATVILGLSLAVGPACGRKGPLEVPQGRGPMAVEGLTAVQRGQAVILEWKNPTKAVSGRPLTEIEAVEVWVFDRGLPAGGRALSAAEVEKTARLARRIARADFPGFLSHAGAAASAMAFPFVFDPGPEGPKRPAFTVRVLDGKDRASDFVAPVAADILACPKPPRSVEARAFADFIEVSWLASDSNIDGTRPEFAVGYAVFRSEGDGHPRKLTSSPLAGLRFEDGDFEFGKAYRYFVRACVAGKGGAVESADSAAAEIVPRDVFPPAAPAGLVAVSGDGFVSLGWRPAKEPDLDGYRIWRKTAGSAAFAPLGAGLLRETAFTDRSVERGAAYVYAASAVDLAGNEGPMSDGATVVVKGGRP